jgi:ABC-type lipoprotein export system ATPase subunit
MKKIDLHIHTIPTLSDGEFEFCLDKLVAYVKDMQINAIAITNHNTFDINQYNAIKNVIPDTVIFPGVEVNITNSKNDFGHLIIITSENNAADFDTKCQVLGNEITTQKASISLERMVEIFGDLNKYLLIPHYCKEPKLSEENLQKLKQYICCGEVDSVKKFMYCKKNPESLTPVYFSDCRLTEDSVLPMRQTYVGVDELSIQSLKLCFKEHSKVNLTEDEVTKEFWPLPNVKMSAGLNVIIGERSSGKTTLLNEIVKRFDRIKYIKQFELVETDPDQAEKDFNKNITKKNSDFSEEYLSDFKGIVNDIKSIDIDADKTSVENYVSSLIKSAKESARADAYSKCVLFKESLLTFRDISSLKSLIESISTLLSNTEYKEEIEKYIDYDVLKKMYLHFIDLYKKEMFENKKKEYANSIVKTIKTELGMKSASTPVPELDLVSVAFNQIKVKKFNDLVTTLKQPLLVKSQQIENFYISITREPFGNATEVKNVVKNKLSLVEPFKSYNNSPYLYLRKLIECESLDDADIYKMFVKLDYKILNSFELPVSGGERAEYNLLQKIRDAHQYDMLLIDEPESSFDNPFLRDRVNNIIKNISADLPVVIVTHNSTIGTSLNPDYLIYTERVIDDDTHIPTFKVYYGNASDKYLTNSDGEMIANYAKTMEYLEGGEEKYIEREHIYENLKN